jgi:hypothetical protein
MISPGDTTDPPHADQTCPASLPRAAWPVDMWRKARWQHAAVNRALDFAPDLPGAGFALFPFRLAKVDDMYRILAAWPCPRTTGPDIDLEHDGIDAVLAWCPETNRVDVLGDPQPQLIGSFDGYFGPGSVFGQPRAFFQQWAADRARFFNFVRSVRRSGAHPIPIEPDLVPGMLIVGPVNKVRWPNDRMPAVVNCIGVSPAAVGKAFLQSLQLPRFTATMSDQAQRTAGRAY